MNQYFKILFYFLDFFKKKMTFNVISISLKLYFKNMFLFVNRN